MEFNPKGTDVLSPEYYRQLDLASKAIAAAWDNWPRSTVLQRLAYDGGLALAAALADQVLLGLVNKAGVGAIPVRFFKPEGAPEHEAFYGAVDGFPGRAIWMPIDPTRSSISHPIWFMHELKHVLDEKKGRTDLLTRPSLERDENIDRKEYERQWNKNRGEQRAEDFAKQHLVRTKYLTPKKPLPPGFWEPRHR